jgi:quercetin dioxygenase-like cupin family protein
MNPSSSLPSVVVLPGSGKVIRAFGDEVTVHLGTQETGGKFTMFTDVTPPGGGPPPHYHANEDEWFFPLEGRIEFYREGAWTEVPLGTVVFLPRGTVHAFRNPGQKPLRMLVHTAPSGFETFFSRCAEEFAKPGPPDMKRIVEISAEHGIFFVEG